MTRSRYLGYSIWMQISRLWRCGSYKKSVPAFGTIARGSKGMVKSPGGHCSSFQHVNCLWCLTCVNTCRSLFTTTTSETSTPVFRFSDVRIDVVLIWDCIYHVWYLMRIWRFDLPPIFRCAYRCCSDMYLSCVISYEYDALIYHPFTDVLFLYLLPSSAFPMNVSMLFLYFFIMCAVLFYEECDALIYYPFIVFPEPCVLSSCEEYVSMRNVMLWSTTPLSYFRNHAGYLLVKSMILPYFRNHAC